ncbi:hypothetical protein CDAR_231691 [Caerostris darwini]|uniref:Uncharacterized protein n=1 Tax=Caerostris darwini TaxID=1538125 RepID=A0AAV4X8B5_9ARAC|nr:hypothetical protein CDAR_231561 [Caerostris darwini]GIY90104.1 hypothetical protein CDAR_231691 [Caerostris darwini]
MNRFKKKMHFKKKWRDLEDSINLQHKPDEYEFEDFEQCENYFTTSESEAENVNVNEKCRRGMSTRNFSVLSSFYGDILYKLLKKFSIKNADLEESVNHITRIYNSLKKGKLPEDIDYGEITNCLGYLHKYAPCHSALVCKCMVKVLISSSACVLTNIFQKASLDVVFLGSGPGNDFVGFMHALDEKCKIPSNINVTVVDKMSGWTEIFLESVQELKSSKEVCKISEHINVIPSFMVHDLKQCIVHNEEMKMKMRNADIVFLVKVLSRIPHEYKLTVLKVKYYTDFK